MGHNLDEEVSRKQTEDVSSSSPALQSSLVSQMGLLLVSTLQPGKGGGGCMQLGGCKAGSWSVIGRDTRG